MVLGKLPVPGRPTILITVGQGPTALAVGAGGGGLDIFTLIYTFSPLSPSLWETARYRLKYCLKGPLNPKQPTNQPRQGPRTQKGTFRTGLRGSDKGVGVRPIKRPRVSAESAGSSSTVESPIDTNKTFSLENFKTLSIDSKLETMFACLLDVKATIVRLLKAERTVKQLSESPQVNSRRIDLLAYKSIDIEARQRRNNLLFWGIPEVRNEDCLTVISEFLGDKVGLDADAITIQRARRIGKPQMLLVELFVFVIGL